MKEKMRFEYVYRNTASDLWQLSMYYTYGSMVGVCNIIFTAAMFILAAVRWGESSVWMRTAIVLGCCLFTIFQPLFVYAKARRQAAGIGKDTQIAFDVRGIHIKVGEEVQNLEWKSIKRVSKKPTMIVVFSDTTHGFVLPNRILGTDRKGFYEFVVSLMNH